MKKTLMILITGLALTLFAAQSFAAGESGVDIHGFISQGYISTTENNFTTDTKEGTFEFNEMGINFGKQLTDKLRIGVQLFARDFGENGNNEVKIDWAYADYRFRDWLGVRFGQLKSPHGLYNEYRDIDTLRTFIFLPQTVYPEITRDVTLSIQGGGFYGNIDMKALGWLSYQAYYGTQTVDSNSRLSEFLAGYPENLITNDTTEVDDKYAVNLVWDTPLSGLRLGASYDNTEMELVGHWNTTFAIFQEGDSVGLINDPYENWVYSMEFTWKNLVLMAEYMKTEKDYTTTIVGAEEGKAKLKGWYAGGAYRFADWFELGAYYSTTDNDTGTSDSGFTLPDYFMQLTDICVTTRFDINEYWTLKLEYHDLTGALGLSSWDNPSDTASFINPDYFEEDWTMFAAKLTVAF